MVFGLLAFSGLLGQVPQAIQDLLAFLNLELSQMMISTIIE